MADDTMELMARIGIETSLRYAIHMIIAASLAATKRKSGTVEMEDIKRVYRLFVDVKRSTQYLMEYNKEFMFNELDDRTTEYGVDNNNNPRDGKDIALAGGDAKDVSMATTP